MVIDLKLCIGCQSCSLACKAEYGIPRGTYWTKTLIEEVGTYPNVTRIYTPQICNHCEEAPCEKACPTGASYTDEESGVVLVDYDKCVGCRACYVACPYQNRHYLKKGSLKGYFSEKGLTPFEKQSYAEFQEGIVTKCVGCIERVNAGQNPACVDGCPTNARKFGDLSDPESEIRRIIRTRHAVQPMPEKGTEPKVYYVS
jgi:molybdopterin-containing oxidoreductase family iron-sulfur binding subunit